MKKQSDFAFVFWAAASIFIVIIAVFGSSIAPHDPLATNYSAVNLAPSREYIMGTDHLGRCIFSRIICGTGTSVFSTFIIIAATTLIGTALGIIAGLCGGLADAVIMKLVTIFQAFPSTVFAIAVAGILGSGIKNAVIAMIVIGWPETARLSRSMTLKIKESAYLKVAKLYGCGTGGMIVRHIFPNIRSLIVVNATLGISSTMLTMASLSFLGLSAQPPTPEWGYMLNEGRKVFLTAPGRVLFPGLAIFIVVVIFSRLGDCIEQRLNTGKPRRTFWSLIKTISEEKS